MPKQLIFYGFHACAAVVLAIALALALWDTQPLLFSRSIFFLLLMTCFLLLTLYLRTPNNLLGRYNDWLRPSLGAVALLTSISLVQGFDFRVLADETNLLSTSLGLFLHKSLINITELFFYYDGFHLKSADIAHRPGFFAFLASLLHHLIGYRWFNGFIVNLLVGFVTLTAVFLFFRKHANFHQALACMVLLAAFPIFQLNVTSSGFDALNMLMVALFYMQLYRFMHNPEGRQFEILCCLAILAAQTRYETAVLVVPLALAFALKWQQLRQASFSPALLTLPFLALPVIWQKLISRSFANPGESVEAVFAPEHMLSNALHMLQYFSSGQSTGQPVLGWVFYLSVAGLLMLLWRCWRQNNWRTPGMLTFYLCVTGHMLISIAQFSYYYGNYQLAWINRLSQVQLIWIVPLAAYALVTLTRPLRHTSGPALFFVLGLAFLMGSTVAHTNATGKSLTLFKEFKQVRQYLQAHYPPTQTLVINDRSGMYAALGYSAINTRSAMASHRDLGINLERGLFQDMVLVEMQSAITPAATGDIHRQFITRELARFQTNASEQVVLYRIEGVSEDEL